MNYNHISYVPNNFNSLNNNHEHLIKNKQKQKVSQVVNQRGRNTHQLTDITNLSNMTVNNNFNNMKYTNVIYKEEKKKSLSRKSSVNSRNNSKSSHINKYMNKKNKQDYKKEFINNMGTTMSIDNSAKNLHKEISNSFGGSTMILDDHVLTRNQCNEKLTQNPQMALEYIESILKDFFFTEKRNYLFYPLPNYMKIIQKDINDKMRVILYDWLVDVNLKWKLMPETLFITFNVIDRFLGMRPAQRDELQCIGVSSLLIACKYEEIYFPEISDFQEITDNAFSKSEILNKELEILSYLTFDITVPSPLRFFEIFNIYLKLEGKEKNAVLYLLELSVFDYTLLKYKPSLIATGCCMLIVSHNKFLKESLFLVSNYGNEEIALFCKDLIGVYYKIDNGSKSLKRKFSMPKYSEVAKGDIISELASKHNNY